MDDEREDILKVCFSVIFENELEGWVIDEAMWPKNRDLATFTRWFDVEFHSVIVDLWDQPLEHEDA
jgi:hypothetical protein